MRSNDILFVEFLRVIKLYNLGKLSLPEFTSDIEMLMENMEDRIEKDYFESAMGHVHAIELINAIALSEERGVTVKEREDVNEELNNLKKIIFATVECDA